MGGSYASGALSAFVRVSRHKPFCYVLFCHPVSCLYLCLSNKHFQVFKFQTMLRQSEGRLLQYNLACNWLIIVWVNPSKRQKAVLDVMEIRRMGLEKRWVIISIAVLKSPATFSWERKSEKKRMARNQFNSSHWERYSVVSIAVKEK